MKSASLTLAKLQDLHNLLDWLHNRIKQLKPRLDAWVPKIYLGICIFGRYLAPKHRSEVGDTGFMRQLAAYYEGIICRA